MNDLEKLVWSSAYASSFIQHRKVESALVLAYYAVKQLREQTMKPATPNDPEALRLARNLAKE